MVIGTRLKSHRLSTFSTAKKVRKPILQTLKPLRFKDFVLLKLEIDEQLTEEDQTR